MLSNGAASQQEGQNTRPLDGALQKQWDNDTLYSPKGFGIIAPALMQGEIKATLTSLPLLQ